MADEGFVSVILQGPACGPHVAYLSPEAVKVVVAEAVAAAEAENARLRAACRRVADAHEGNDDIFDAALACRAALGEG